MRLKDKVAIITGGGTGIGAATARLFAAEGARICVFGRRPEPLQTVVASIRADGGNALAVTGNVSDTADGQRLVDETMQAYDRVDILVSSAGTATLMKAVDTTDELWNSVIDTNLTGTFRIIRAVLPVMSAQQSGCVINVSSVLGQSGMKHTAAYSASKAGIDQLTRVLALEYASVGIRVNAVAPGWVDTPMTESVQAHDRMYAMLKDRHPVGRFGTPEEVAHAILYLSSAEAAWVTGTILSVDGGWTAQ